MLNIGLEHNARRSSAGVKKYLLDKVGGAVGAYSLRKLRKSYSGPCIRVRRSSDNAELDIGFIGENLDTATLLSFVGADDGSITICYDQSGNSNDAYQSNATYQPNYVSNCISFSNMDWMDIPDSTITEIANTTLIAVVKRNSLSEDCNIIGSNYTPNRLYFGYRSDGRFYNRYSDATQLNSSKHTSIDDINMVYADYNGSTQRLLANGTIEASQNITKSGGVSALNIGSFNAGSSAWFQGKLYELIIFASVLSDVNRQKIEGSMAHAYSFADKLPAGHPYKTVSP